MEFSGRKLKQKGFFHSVGNVICEVGTILYIFSFRINSFGCQFMLFSEQLYISYHPYFINFTIIRASQSCIFPHRRTISIETKEVNDWNRGTSILVWYFLLTNQLTHTSPIRTLLSYTAPYSASPHPSQLPFTTVNSANPSYSAIPHPTQLHRTLLIYPASVSATQYPTLLSRTSHQLLRTLLCYIAPYSTQL